MPDDIADAGVEAELDEDLPPSKPMSHTYACGARFVSLSKEQVPPEMLSIVARMHLMYGYPQNKNLNRAVAQEGAPLPVLACVKAL